MRSLAIRRGVHLVLMLAVVAVLLVLAQLTSKTPTELKNNPFQGSSMPAVTTVHAKTAASVTATASTGTTTASAWQYPELDGQQTPMGKEGTLDQLRNLGVAETPAQDWASAPDAAVLGREQGEPTFAYGIAQAIGGKAAFMAATGGSIQHLFGTVGTQNSSRFKDELYQELHDGYLGTGHLPSSGNVWITMANDEQNVVRFNTSLPLPVDPGTLALYKGQCGPVGVDKWGNVYRLCCGSSFVTGTPSQATQQHFVQTSPPATTVTYHTPPPTCTSNCVPVTCQNHPSMPGCSPPPCTVHPSGPGCTPPPCTVHPNGPGCKPPPCKCVTKTQVSQPVQDDPTHNIHPTPGAPTTAPPNQDPKPVNNRPGGGTGGGIGTPAPDPTTTGSNSGSGNGSGTPSGSTTNPGGTTTVVGLPTTPPQNTGQGGSNSGMPSTPESGGTGGSSTSTTLVSTSASNGSSST